MQTSTITYSHPTTVLLLTLCIALVFMSGCGEVQSYKPQAVGPEGKMTVLIDSAQWNGAVGDHLREALGGPIYTLPAPEPMFDLTRGAITSQRAFDLIKRQKNVVIVAPLSDTTTIAQFISNRLDEGAREMVNSGVSAFIPRNNLWSRDQLVAYVTAATPEELAGAIQERSEDLLYEFNKKTRERLQKDMFEKGRQFEIEQVLMDKYDFAVNVQHDYLIAEDTTNFVQLRRIISSESWRSLFVYFEDNANPNDLTSEWVYTTRDSLSKLYMQGNVIGYAQIDRRRPLTTENIDFLGKYGFESRGLWHMVAEAEDGFEPLGMGGPFLSYAFYDEESGRNYLIDGMIFAPNYPKREFLRQLEVIAYTFRSADTSSSNDLATAAEQ
ncbi:MAG: DUF4837 family protein [Rhodothermaceae bacterium]|nr:DUF4837 family protein [Rhodothermaceae bacterium]